MSSRGKRAFAVVGAVSAYSTGKPMELDVRPVRRDDATELADLLNQIIARGGTTALEEPFTPEALAQTYLTGPDVICCFVAVDRVSGRLEGFQTLGLSQVCQRMSAISARSRG